MVEQVWNVMAHVQKPDLVFQRSGRVHLNWRGGQFSRLLAAEVCASAVVMLDTQCSEVECKTTGSRGVRVSGINGSNAGYTMFWGRVQDYWLPTPLACFPFTSPTVCHRVPSGFNWALHIKCKWIRKKGDEAEEEEERTGHCGRFPAHTYCTHRF